MAGAWVQRCYREVVDFLSRPPDRPRWHDELVELLARALRADALALLHTDPDTFLALDGQVRGFAASATSLFFRHIYLQRERVSFLDLRAQGETTSLLSDYTDGRLEREPRYVEVYRPHHLRHEMRACLVAGRGYWGGLCAARGDDAADFDRSDRRLVERLAPQLGAALRRARLVQGATSCLEGKGSAEAAVLVVDRMGGAVLWQTASAAGVLEELFDTALSRNRADPLPLALRSLVASAGRSRSFDREPAAWELTVQGRSGRWWTASLLAMSEVMEAGVGCPRDAVAILLAPARPASTLRGIAWAYDLTEREAEVLELVACGLGTGEIASRLWVTPYTVQDHLKHIFAKLGVSSRRELMARIFHLESPLERAFAPGDRG